MHTASQAHFHARARDGLSLCFALCEALVDALAEIQQAEEEQQEQHKNVVSSGRDPVSYGNDSDEESQARPQSAGMTSSVKEHAMMQVLGNVDDVAGLLLQFVEQQAAAGDDVDENVVLACVRMLGR